MITAFALSSSLSCSGQACTWASQVIPDEAMMKMYTLKDIFSLRDHMQCTRARHGCRAVKHEQLKLLISRGTPHGYRTECPGAKLADSQTQLVSILLCCMSHFSLQSRHIQLTSQACLESLNIPCTASMYQLPSIRGIACFSCRYAQLLC